MKNLITLLILSFFLTSIKAQISIKEDSFTFLYQETKNKVSEEIKKISYKKYSNVDFKPANINKNDKQHFLRFNIHKNEMEFIKNNRIFYLEKRLGNEIFFESLKTNYKVYSLNDKLLYFKVDFKGKNSLLTKQTIDFIEEKEPKTGYDQRTPPNFKKRDDEFYLAKNNELKLISSKKKKFYPLFGNRATEIKIYVKKNKLNIKKNKDLKKIITYYNSL